MEFTGIVQCIRIAPRETYVRITTTEPQDRYFSLYIGASATDMESKWLSLLQESKFRSESVTVNVNPAATRIVWVQTGSER